MTHDDLLASAREWMLDDPDAETVAELSALVDACELAPGSESGTDAGAEANTAAKANAAHLATLADCFTSRLAFGTAGLRGIVGAGPNRMNRKVVSQTSLGFARYLHELAATDLTESAPSCVIGFDARRKSQEFAQDAAEVLAGAGVRVIMLPGPCPTPLVAFAVRQLNMSAGVMITASHNPAQDNGYKVYLGGADAGSQIAPPVDAHIAAHIMAAAEHPLSEIVRSVDFERAGSEVEDAYVAATASSVPAAQGSANLKIVYTAMHGVGANITRRVFGEAGLPAFVSVAEQEQPDGNFPTVAYPNPEEPGALDLAKALAASEQADLIVAHDPDADRLAIALRNRDGLGFTQLTGNQLGLLLGWECAEQWKHSGHTQNGANGTLAATVVSSPALGAVAEAYGLDFTQTLSGFKWVSRVPNLVFGFEEALGYLVNPEVVRDKDGISAAALAVSLAKRLAGQAKTLWDQLDEASMRFGHFASDQLVVRLERSADVERLSASIRQQPPTMFGDVAVKKFTDFMDEASGFGGMPVPANVLRFDLADGSRVMIRPSGTEPKLKLYLDTSCAEGTLAHRQQVAEAMVARLRRSAEQLLAEQARLANHSD